MYKISLEKRKEGAFSCQKKIITTTKEITTITKAEITIITKTETTTKKTTITTVDNLKAITYF